MAKIIPHPVGETVDIQFVWQIPEGDFLRAVFIGEVTDHDETTDRYILRLIELKAARQEKSNGTAVPPQFLSETYWPMVKGLIGRKAALAFEAIDGRPIRLRLATLTLDHSFFTRYEEE